MNFHTLKQICKKYDIPDDVKLMSDSGWECSESDMDGVYYNAKRNVIIFTQNISEYDTYFNESDWQPLYSDTYNWEKGGK